MQKNFVTGGQEDPSPPPHHSALDDTHGNSQKSLKLQAFHGSYFALVNSYVKESSYIVMISFRIR